MLRITVRVRGVENVRRALGEVSGEKLVRVIQRGLNRSVREIATAAKQRAPYASGKLRRAIHWQPGDDPARAEAFVIVPPVDGKPLGVWHHEGTGIYGPRGAPITPKHAKALRFETTHGKGFVRIGKTGKARRSPSHVQFAKSVKGIPPNPFLLDAYESALAIGLVEKEVAASVNEAVQDRAPKTGGNEPQEGAD